MHSKPQNMAQVAFNENTLKQRRSHCYCKWGGTSETVHL